MRILALDSSGLVATVAIVEDDCLKSEEQVRKHIDSLIYEESPSNNSRFSFGSSNFEILPIKIFTILFHFTPLRSTLLHYTPYTSTRQKLHTVL